MENHFLEKLGKNRKYRDLDVKRKVDGSVVFEDMSSGAKTHTGISTGSTYEAGSHDGPVQAIKIIAGTTGGGGTPSAVGDFQLDASPTIPTVGGGTMKLTATDLAGFTATSFMLDELNPKFNFVLNTLGGTTSPTGITFTVQKEQNID